MRLDIPIFATNPPALVVSSLSSESKAKCSTQWSVAKCRLGWRSAAWPSNPRPGMYTSTTSAPSDGSARRAVDKPPNSSDSARARSRPVPANGSASAAKRPVMAGSRWTQRTARCTSPTRREKFCSSSSKNQPSRACRTSRSSTRRITARDWVRKSTRAASPANPRRAIASNTASAPRRAPAPRARSTREHLKHTTGRCRRASKQKS